MCRVQAAKTFCMAVLKTKGKIRTQSKTSNQSYSQRYLGPSQTSMIELLEKIEKVVNGLYSQLPNSKKGEEGNGGLNSISQRSSKALSMAAA